MPDNYESADNKKVLLSNGYYEFEKNRDGKRGFKA